MSADTEADMRKSFVCCFAKWLQTSYAAVDAFVACGGMRDGTGCVKRDTLVKIIKGDFGLAIDFDVSLTFEHSSHC